MTRGKRLKALREKLGLTLELVAELSGHVLTRFDVGRAEKDEIEWRAQKAWSGFAAAYSMTVEQLRAFLDETPPPMLAAVQRVRPRADAILQLAQERAECDAAAREGLTLAGLAEDEFADAVLLALRRIAQREGSSVSREFLAERAKAAKEQLVQLDRDSAERARDSHKRPSGSNIPRR